jgi:dienelactone hydrolase
MTEVILFHHALGLTPGVQELAEQLRAGGHRVTVPDLYEGATFASLRAGVAHAQEIGMDKVGERGAAATEAITGPVVYAGTSLGSMVAQKLAQTRPNVLGALFYEGGDIPVTYFADGWPEGVPLQIHLGELDEEMERDVIDEVVKAVPGAEFYVYPGARHLFTERGFEAYDAGATALVVERSLEFLARFP